MATQIKCPICGKTTQWQDNPFRPFCSERCKLIDLGHWMDEDYALPAEEGQIDEESGAQRESQAMSEELTARDD